MSIYLFQSNNPLHTNSNHTYPMSQEKGQNQHTTSCLWCPSTHPWHTHSAMSRWHRRGTHKDIPMWSYMLNKSFVITMITVSTTWAWSFTLSPPFLLHIGVAPQFTREISGGAGVELSPFVCKGKQAQITILCSTLRRISWKKNG